MNQPSHQSNSGGFAGVDLHTHSTASDGLLSPADLITAAGRASIRVLALTDHDTIGGIAEATEAATAAGIELIPGVELSSESGPNEIHILGYYVDPQSDELLTSLDHHARERERRSERIVGRLRALGIEISYDRVREIAGAGSIGRPHIARAMIERGVVLSVGEAFDRYLAHGRPGFVPRTQSSPFEAVSLLRRTGALPVLAHPLTTGEVASTLRELVPAGLAGMEVFYGEYSSVTHVQLLGIATEWNLIPTGGSDFHGVGFKEGRELGVTPVPISSAEQLRGRWESLQGR